VRRLLALPLLIAVSMGVELPQDVPIPTENPRPQATSGSAPVPAARPDDAAAAQAVPVPQEKTGPDAPVTEPAGAGKSNPLPSISRPEPDEVALARCEAELRKLGAVFVREDPVQGENGCGIEAPYSITQIIRGVALSPASQMRCATALALARWTDTVVLPAASALPGKAGLTGINHGSTYVCRRRNNLPTGKMSEHSIGNAIDIVDFEFDERQPIGMSPRQGDGDIEEAFQRALRGGACLHFTTVLGPGSDTSHAGHLHLDIAERRGGYRLCQ
jgi:hypothetical protein